MWKQQSIVPKALIIVSLRVSYEVTYLLFLRDTEITFDALYLDVFHFMQISTETNIFQHVFFFYDHLNWNSHVKSIVSKAWKRVGLLGRLRRYLTAHSANTIYISMIRPIIEYCVGVWACCGEVNSGYLEALQKRAARVVVKTGSSSDAMASVMWPTLKERRRKHVYNLVNKSFAGRCPQHLINYFKHNKDVCVRSTRRANCYICLLFVRKLPKDLFNII